MSKAASIPPSHPNPKTTTADRSQSVTVNGANGFLIHSDTEDADIIASMDISQSSSPRTGSTEVLVSQKLDPAEKMNRELIAYQREKSPNSLSPTDFVPAYRKAIDAREACQEKIDANKKEQEDLLRDMQLIETRLSELREEERKLEEEHRLAGVSKKRLRESLSEKERELLMFGFEIARRESKRLRTEMVSDEGTGGEGD
jgi:chromosome segregation ATPase